MLVRKATEEDFTQIHPLIIKRTEEFGLPTSHVPNIKKLVEDYSSNSPKFYCLVCELDTRIIGYVSYSYAYSSWIGRSININELYVLLGYRDVGQLPMLHRLVNITLELKCLQVKCSAPDNTEFSKFLVENGTSVMSKEDGYSLYNLEAEGFKKLGAMPQI
ncbi:SAT1 [Bugula neritina]|uniref:SAT1 n=1 Tax=Bugula neritina TaxID=10212 RepID=A0A7J7JTK1_BUGNE|nr:SAT1 [Bugula neritina]